MLGLAVVVPALLFSVWTVLLAAQEERALPRLRQSVGDGPPDGGSTRKVR